MDLEDYDPDGSRAEAWREALEALEVDAAELTRALCGLLLLAELRFEAGEDGVAVRPPDALPAAAAALGVEEAALRAAFTTAGSAAGASASLSASLEGCYRRLVVSVTQAANASMGGGEDAAAPSGHGIGIMEVPAMPCELDRPEGFDLLQLQWLSETVQAGVLAAALGVWSEPVMDLAAEQQKALRALDTIESPSRGLAGALRSAQEAPLAGGRSGLLAAWAEAQDGPDASPDGAAASQPTCRIDGASGCIEHALGERLARDARGVDCSPRVSETLRGSSLPLLAAAAVAAVGPMGLAGAEQALGTIRDALRAASVRPWLVCCLRPNEKGLSGKVHGPTLLRQVRRWRLDDLAHLSAGGSWVWPHEAFRQRYEALLRGAEREASDAEACRLLLSLALPHDGTVGAEKVYGSEALLRALDAKVFLGDSGQPEPQPDQDVAWTGEEGIWRPVPGGPVPRPQPATAQASLAAEMVAGACTAAQGQPAVGTPRRCEEERSKSPTADTAGAAAARKAASSDGQHDVTGGPGLVEGTSGQAGQGRAVAPAIREPLKELLPAASHEEQGPAKGERLAAEAAEAAKKAEEEHLAAEAAEAARKAKGEHLAAEAAEAARKAKEERLAAEASRKAVRKAEEERLVAEAARKATRKAEEERLAAEAAEAARKAKEERLAAEAARKAARKAEEERLAAEAAEAAPQTDGAPAAARGGPAAGTKGPGAAAEGTGGQRKEEQGLEGQSSGPALPARHGQPPAKVRAAAPAPAPAAAAETAADRQPRSQAAGVEAAGSQKSSLDP